MNNGPLYALAPAFGISFFTQSTCCPLCMHALPVHMQIQMFVYCYEFWLRITKPSPPQTSCVTWSMSFISLYIYTYGGTIWENFQIPELGCVPQPTRDRTSEPIHPLAFAALFQIRSLSMITIRSHGVSGLGCLSNQANQLFIFQKAHVQLQ